MSRPSEASVDAARLLVAMTSPPASSDAAGRLAWHAGRRVAEEILRLAGVSNALAAVHTIAARMHAEAL